MIWNEVNFPSPQLEIYVQTKMLRHLVELYVTKRIDAIIMSMKIAVERQAVIDTSAILNYCRSLTKMDIFTFVALSANCCQCTLPWHVSEVRRQS